MSTLTFFQFESSSVRVINIDGSPWFVAKDVLTAIGSSTTVTAVEAIVVTDLGKEFVTNQHLDTAGGTQEMLLLSEPAITLFVARSRTELGKALNRWIHVEVLPAIRKTGKYEVKPAPTPQTQTQPKTAADLFVMFAQGLKEQETRLTSLEQEIMLIKDQLANQQHSAKPKTSVPIQSVTVQKRKKPTPLEFNAMQLQALKEIGVTDMLEKPPSTVWTKYSPEIIQIVDVCRLPEYTYLFGFPGKIPEITYTNRLLKLINSHLVEFRAPKHPNGESFREFLLVKF